MVKDLIRLFLVAVFFVGVALLLKSPYMREQLFDINNLRNELQGGGLRNSALFIGAAALINALGLPRIWICGVAGSLFGAVEGSIVGFIATLLGSSLNFLMGRSMLRGPIKRHMPRRLRHWYKAFNEHGFRAILYLRLFPLANATLTNLMGGASRLRFRDYLAATAIGYLPFTIAFATLGSSAVKQNGWQLAAGLVLFAAVAVGQWAWTRRRKNSVKTEVD
jgi:uncharacterized membrane protein YdjX (TVP38/TMEM64 family)